MLISNVSWLVQTRLLSDNHRKITFEWSLGPNTRVGLLAVLNIPVCLVLSENHPFDRH